MGFKREGAGIFRVKCDICGAKAMNDELNLGDAGWTWLEMRVTGEDGYKVLNRACCPDCDFKSSDILEEMKKLAGD